LAVTKFALKIILVKNSAFVIQIISVFSFMGCDYRYNPNDFTFKRKPYEGNELRVDGYYYRVEQSYKGPFYQWNFFYRNGVIRLGGSSLDSLHFQKAGLLGDHGKIIWGYFEILGDSIFYENWTPEGTYIYSGNILNDTTFNITKTQHSSGKDVRKENWLYHFVKYSPKPDSVSRFID
jgi:hypothetical protein